MKLLNGLIFGAGIGLITTGMLGLASEYDAAVIFLVLY